MSKRHDLGVLFVHGIGAQRRGDTLLEFGDPLVESLRDWLGPQAVKLRVRTPAPGRPVHARVTIRVGRRRRKRRLLVAEAWWAETFYPPGWWALAAWLAWSVPFIVVRAIDHQVGMITTNRRLDDTRAWKTAPAWLFNQGLRVVKNLLSAVIALFATIVLLLLGVIAVIPAVRRWILSAQRLLIRYIGDSYYLLMSPGRGAAMVTQVEHDLKWLERRAPRVAIVAHSQGADIVRRVLERRERNERPIRSLVTFGSGIAKLRAVRRLHDQPGKSTTAYLIRLGAALLTVAPLVPILLGADWWIIALAAVVAVVGSALLIGLARKMLQQVVQDGAPFAKELRRVRRSRLRAWLDFYATSDPVPEGPLPLAGLELRTNGSQRIANFRSPVRDHTAYWKNGEAFRPAVLEELSRLLGRQFTPSASKVVRQSRERRASSSMLLVWVRVGILAAVLAACLLPLFGVLQDAWNSSAAWLGRQATWVAEWFGGDPGRHVVTVVAVLLVAVVVYSIVAWQWSAVAASRARNLFRRPQPCRDPR